MILPETFVRPEEFSFVCSGYCDGIFSLEYCSHNKKEKRYIMGINDVYSDEPNIVQSHIVWTYILENLKEFERNKYKKELMKEMNIKFRYIK